MDDNDVVIALCATSFDCVLPRVLYYSILCFTKVNLYHKILMMMCSSYSVWDITICNEGVKCIVHLLHIAYQE